MAAQRGAGGTLSTSPRLLLQSSTGQAVAPPANAPIRQSSNHELATGFQAAFLSLYNTPTPTPTPIPTPPLTRPPPTPTPFYALRVDNGAQYTYRTDVTLQLLAPWDIQQVLVSSGSSLIDFRVRAQDKAYN